MSRVRFVMVETVDDAFIRLMVTRQRRQCRNMTALRHSGDQEFVPNDRLVSHHIKV